MADIATMRANALEALATAMASPKPSYSIDGQSVDHDAYVKRLQDFIDWCDKKLKGEDSDSDEGGSVEVTTYGV